MIAVPVIIGHREIEVGNGAMALGANIGHRDLYPQAVRITHFEGMAAGQGESRIGIGHTVDNDSGCHRLHMAAGTGVGYHIGVRRAGNHFAVGLGVHAFEHVALRAVMRAESYAAGPVGLIQRIFRQHDWCQNRCGCYGIPCRNHRRRRWSPRCHRRA